MGFIQSNHSVILYNNTMISFNMMEASRRNGVKRFFYSSSACVYPEYRQVRCRVLFCCGLLRQVLIVVTLQTETHVAALKESDAWPAQPQDAYGMEKLITEELCMHYQKDFGIEVRIARFHNIYGPFGASDAETALVISLEMRFRHVEGWSREGTGAESVFVGFFVFCSSV
jgi:GDP-D-mannose 3',5'-epimerase